jgi:molybdenum cofactor biosynthesis enzyme MoaA
VQHGVIRFYRTIGFNDMNASSRDELIDIIRKTGIYLRFTETMKNLNMYETRFTIDDVWRKALIVIKQS